MRPRACGAEWSATELDSAPPTARGFYSFYGMELYALQQALGATARSSTTLASFVAGAVLLLLTRNAIVALYATATIVLIVIAVTGILVSMGW